MLAINNRHLRHIGGTFAAAADHSLYCRNNIFSTSFSMRKRCWRDGSGALPQTAVPRRRAAHAMHHNFSSALAIALLIALFLWQKPYARGALATIVRFSSLPVRRAASAASRDIDFPVALYRAFAAGTSSPLGCIAFVHSTARLCNWLYHNIICCVPTHTSFSISRSAGKGRTTTTGRRKRRKKAKTAEEKEQEERKTDGRTKMPPSFLMLRIPLPFTA